MPSEAEQRRWARRWDRTALSTDYAMRILDRLLFRDTRAWVCGRAIGDVLEVGIGTGLNLPHYPMDVALLGIDLSPAMIELTRARALRLGRRMALRIGDAEHVDLPDASVDTVVCTFALCGVPNHCRAIDEMARVLRPGGRLLLADHVVAAAAPLRAMQRLIEVGSIPLMGEHLRRRPVDEVRARGLTVLECERFAGGLVERLSARIPS